LTRTAGDRETLPADGPPAEPVEVEVKLSVARPRVVGRLIRHPDPDLLAGFHPAGEAHLVRVTDRYLDTAQVNGRLAAGLVRARLRRHGRGVTLTVKRPGVEAAGVTTRVELEAPANRALAPDRWPASAARTVVLDIAGGASLGEIALLRQHRLTRVFRRGGTRVEVSLDRLDALDGGRVADRRYELEAELLAGDAAALAELAGALGRVVGVAPALGSKLGFALAARAAAGARNSAPNRTRGLRADNTRLVNSAARREAGPARARSAQPRRSQRTT
jgi:inorganic triphosphatase YgiF